MEGTETQEPRPFVDDVVNKFAYFMKEAMLAHEHKGNWRQLTPAQAVDCIRRQLYEAEQALADHSAGKVPSGLITKKCIDGANYFMILADTAGAL